MSSEITIFESAVLGLVQGLTEFIPVSSSAHLNIAHTAMGQGRKLAYDVVLSLGTTVALGYYFRHDWKALLTNPAQAKLRNLVLLGCVPAVLFGVVVHKFQNKPPINQVWFNALLLAVAGIVLYIADVKGRKERPLESVDTTDSLLVGVAQALALFPGVSRSGGTITMGLFRGMTRDAAARFSFLMSLPISIGALVYEFYKDVYLLESGPIGADLPGMLVGVAVSAVSGFWAIGFLLNYLRRRNVLPFVIWRLVVAVLVWMFLKSPEPSPKQPAKPASRAALFKAK